MAQAPKEIKVNPENYKEMIEKLEEREQEQLEKFKARHKVDVETGSETNPLKIAKRTLAARAARSEPKKPLEDDTVLTEAKSPEIHLRKKELTEEALATSQKIHKLLQTMPTLENKVVGMSKLKGRISQNPPSAEGG